MEFDKNKIKTKIAISKIIEENDIAMSNKGKNIIKTISTAAAGVLLCTGVVFAGTKVYENIEKIWKEPVEYHNIEEYINELPHEITEEEKEKSISEEEAKELGLEILGNLGYENQTINRIELKKGYIQNGRGNYYMVKTKPGFEQGLMVLVDAVSGEFICFEDLDLKYQHLPTQTITDVEIAKVATDYCKKLKLENPSYKLFGTEVTDYYFEDQKSILLSATYYKYYDNIPNKFESYRFSFFVVDGEIKLNSIIISKDFNFQNNELVISKDEAIDIVKNKENELCSYEITNIDGELAFEKMNTFIYTLEHNENNDEDYYVTDDITRKVWKIKVEHYEDGMNKYYFVDATTGEIIGGMQAFDPPVIN